MKQHTLKKSFSISGIGLHTGEKVNMTFHPAPDNHGIKFKRIDLENQPEIRADVGSVVSTNRGTSIGNSGAIVHTVEHALAALSGMEIDNTLIEIDGIEVPILDGSAIGFTEKLLDAGKVAQDADRVFIEIPNPIAYKDDETGTELIVLPADEFEITTMIDFNSTTLGQQYAYLKSIKDFNRDISPARTFVFLREIEALINQGLIKGGDLDNAIVIVDRLMNQQELDDLAKKLHKPSMKVDKKGYLNTTNLKFRNEPARHKLLDVIGDLALVGKPIKGKVVTTKPGHTANVELAKILKKLFLEQRKLKGIPKYDPNTPPILNSQEIQKWLPHRYPFLLIDKIIEKTDTKVVGVKSITRNEELFQGHFPGNPIFPGVLQIEAMAQTGGILALSTVPDPHNWNTYFLKIDNARFKQTVVPGDTLILKMELTAPIRRGIVEMKGTAYVGNKIVSEGELTAQIIKKD